MSQTSTTQTPTDYISHHLHNWNWAPHASGEHAAGFWSFHLDTFWVALILGFVFLGVFSMVARRATAGVPGRFQNFIEMIVEMVNNQIKEIFHAKSKVIGPLALTVFVWTVLMNAMDFLPVDLLPLIMHSLGFEHFKPVPTADINQALGMSCGVGLAIIGFSIQAKGVGGYIKELFTAPFHAETPFMMVMLLPVNFVMQLIELFSKVLSLALRLAGNMFAGELVYMLIALLATGGALGWAGSVIAGLAWGIFHILVVVLQAYIFMMLTIVYMSLAVEKH